MKPRPLRLIRYAVFLGVAGLLGWALVEAVNADPAVVGAVGTASLGLGGVAWQQRQVEKARLREAHRDRMAPIYDKFLQLVRQLSGDNSTGTQAEVEAFMRDLKARPSYPPYRPEARPARMCHWEALGLCGLPTICCSCATPQRPRPDA